MHIEYGYIFWLLLLDLPLETKYEGPEASITQRWQHCGNSAPISQLRRVKRPAFGVLVERVKQPRAVRSPRSGQQGFWFIGESLRLLVINYRTMRIGCSPCRCPWITAYELGVWENLG